MTPPVPPSKGHKFDSIQVFRGLAALMVAYYHVGYLAKRHLGLTYNGPGWEHGGLGVDFFFVLSGFIITWIHLGDLGHRTRAAGYFLKRAVRIYPLVWIVVLTKVIAAFVFPSLLATLHIDFRNVANSLLLLPTDNYIVEVLWTLGHEMIFYLVFGLWILGGGRFAVAGGLCWAILILWPGPQPDTANLWALKFLSPINLEFLGGCVTAAVLARTVFLPLAASAALCLASAGVAVAALALGISHPIIWTVVFGGLIAGAVSADASGKMRWPRFLTGMGDASFSIYLVHTSVLMLILQAGRKLKMPFMDWGQAALHFSLPVSVICGVICYRLIEKPVQLLMRRHVLREGIKVTGLPDRIRPKSGRRFFKPKVTVP